MGNNIRKLYGKSQEKLLINEYQLLFIIVIWGTSRGPFRDPFRECQQADGTWNPGKLSGTWGTWEPGEPFRGAFPGMSASRWPPSDAEPLRVVTVLARMLDPI